MDNISLTSKDAYKIDLYLKMVMDKLRNHPEVIKPFNNSPLETLHAALKRWMDQANAEDVPPLDPGVMFVGTLLARVTDDIRLRDEYKTGGAGKDRAAAALRQRGLLK